MKILNKMVTLAKFARELRLMRCFCRHIKTLSNVKSSSLIFGFLFVFIILNIHFLLLLIHMITSITTFDGKRRRKERKHIWRSRWKINMMLMLLWWRVHIWCNRCTWIIILENNHIVYPIFNSRRLNVVMKGGKKFPYGGKVQHIPWEGVPLLVVREYFSISILSKKF